MKRKKPPKNFLGGFFLDYIFNRVIIKISTIRVGAYFYK